MLSVQFVPLSGLFDRWNAQSLARQFFLAGGLVSLAAITVVGFFVTNFIEAAVTRNSAAATALYVDSVIAPILPDMTTTERLDETIERALDETLGQGALGQRLQSFRLWRKDGTILYSNDKALMGKRFEPGDHLRSAFAGEMVAEFEDAPDGETETQPKDDQPFLEIYNPILQPWSGEVVAVSEFYEVANDFQHSLESARLKSWFAVATVISLFFLALSAIVFRGSRTIENQSRTLKQRVEELSALLAQNKALHARVTRASQRTAALNESYLRRVGADIHDGPAQLVAFAGLRIDSEILVDPAVPREKRQKEISAIKSSLTEAMREIRDICNGLVLPDIETAELPEILKRVVNAHRQRTGSTVALEFSTPPPTLSASAKICIYRFVQEALNNAFRHAGGIEQSVTQRYEDDCVVVEVADRGPGFDPATIRPTSLGLAGLRERVESLGGRFDITSSDEGTTVTIRLNIQEMEQA